MMPIRMSIWMLTLALASLAGSKLVTAQIIQLLSSATAANNNSFGLKPMPVQPTTAANAATVNDAAPRTGPVPVQPTPTAANALTVNATAAATSLLGCSPIEENVDYVGNDIGRSRSATAEGCCSICNITAGCGAYTWRKVRGGTCWLKSGKSDSTDYNTRKLKRRKKSKSTAPNGCRSGTLNPPTPFTIGVTVCQDSNYLGSCVTLGTGSYGLPALESRGVLNDWISSVIVPSGYSLTGYWDFPKDIFGKEIDSGVTYTTNTSFLGDWDDQISSLMITSGGVTVCQDWAYLGQCVTLPPGKYEDLSDDHNGGVLNEWISSVIVPRGYSLTAYSDVDFKGTMVTYTTENPFVGNYWNDKISSLKVTCCDEIGVTVCQESNYLGSCVTLGVGSYGLPDLESRGVLNDWISSIIVPNGYSLTGYWDFSNDKFRDDPNYDFTHFGVTYTTKTSFLGDWDNQISSLMITSGGVTVCEDWAYLGQCVTLPPGNYDLPASESTLILNEWISSVIVPRGYSVKAYTDAGFLGSSITYNAETPFVGDDWNDKISSLKVISVHT